MRKHLIATCVVLLLLVLGVEAKGGDVKHRTVVLVYDDSGSMRSSGNTTVNRWMYASYALQSLVGLLDKEDRFSYVPMSTPTQEINLSLLNRQADIDGIRNWNQYKNTPFQSVETAIASIKRQVKDREKDEFWLMIVTDGAFNELETGNGTQYDENKKHITETLQQFKAWMDERKISLHAVLVTMESHLTETERQQVSTFKTIWQQTVNGTLMPTDGEDGVVKSVNAAAALVANRDPFSQAEDLIKIDIKGNKATIKTPFSMRRMTVVQQGGNARVTANGLQVEGPYETATPQSLLSGTITHVVAKDRSMLQAGTYELSFDKPITKDTKILVEPALDYNVRLYDSNGNEVKGAVYTGSTVTIEAKPDEVPANTTYLHATLTVGREEDTMQWDATRKAFVIKKKIGVEGMRGQIRMNIKGFYEQTKEWQVAGKEKPLVTLQVKTKHWQADVTKLEESSPFVVVPLVNGRMMTEEEWKTVSFQIDNEERIRYRLRKKNGELYIYPQPYYSNVLNFTTTGTLQATIKMKSVIGDASAPIILSIQPVAFWTRYGVIFQYVLPVCLGIVIFTILIIGWITRPRFTRTAFVSYEMDQSLAEEWIHKSDPESLRNAWWKHYFGIPYRAERRTVQSVTFIAKKGTKAVFIAKESQVEGMVIDGSLLQQDEIGTKHRTLYPNEIITIERGYGKEIYRYECE